MSRTLEPGLTLLTAAEIRVVVLPIGPMPRDNFDAYIGAFNAHRHVPLHATRCFHQGGPKSPFPHLAYKTGAMHFRFMQADEARRRTRIADLHQQRQVVAVLGLLHCPLVEDLLAAHGEFDRASKQWPEALVARCCAFEPSAAHLATPGCQKLKDMMVLPAAHLDAHLEVYMTEFAADVLAAIEDLVLNASVTSVKLTTYVDSGDFLGSLAQIEEGLKKLNMNEEEVKEKKRWGRFQKNKGDWALMAGSPRDAFEHYRSAMELSRVAGDAIWYAAAVEGLAHARVLEALIAARPAASGTARPSVAAVTAARQAAAAAAADQRQGSVAAAESTAPAPEPGSAAAAAAAAASRFAPSAQMPQSVLSQQPPAAAEAVAPGSPKLFTLASTDSADLLQSIIAATMSSPDEEAAAAVSEQEPSAAAAAEAEAELTLPEARTEDTAMLASVLDKDILDGNSADISATNLSPRADSASAAAAAAAADPSRVGHSSSSSAAASTTLVAAAAAAAGTSTTNYALSGPAAWSVLARADLEGEVRELFAEARAWYKKKGGALVLQIEQQLKLSRFIAGLHGPVAAQREAAETVGLIIESLPMLALQEDRLVSLVEAGQLLGLVGCGRKRLLLLWAALEMYRQAASDKGPAEAGGMLKLTLKSLEPPEIPRQQDPGDLPHVHWAMKRFLAWQQQHIQHAQDQQQHTSSAAKLGRSSSRNCSAGQAAGSFSNLSKQQQFMQLLGPRLQLLSLEQASLLEQFASSSATSSPESGFSSAKLWGLRNSATKGLGFGCEWISPWGGVLVAVLESVVNLARAGSSPVEAWEAAATLLRECYPLLPQTLQVSLIEACAAAGAAMGSRARQRPGPGPGPQVQMKRVLPGPPPLQPLHLSAADVGATGGRTSSAAAAAQSGPFIFNPYAAKRQGASAAAAAEAALPEWVCGEEGWVEVLLVNPCATPLKLDQLQLVVQPLPDETPDQQQQRDDNNSSRSAQQLNNSGTHGENPQDQHRHNQQQQGVDHGLGISNPVSDILNPAQAPRSVAVSLPAGSKPVRVLLSYSPPKAGYMAITGIQASCWRVSWYQPFAQLPKLTAAAAGPEALSPQGVFTVSVQPPLPLLKAVLHGPEVQLVAPSEDELAGFTNASSSSSSWSSAAVGAAGGTTPVAAAPAGVAAAAAAAGVAELDKKVTNVFVFEGQSLNWTLSLTNISSQAVAGCKISVLNAKGLIVKPLYPCAPTAAASAGQQQQQLPPSFSGAHMEVGEQGLAASLPLGPGCTVTLPVSVTVGKPPGNAFDAIMLQVRITYYGSASSSDSHVIGRRLLLPIKLSIQPTLQIKSIRFLQQTLPLLNGRRYSKPRLLHIPHSKPPIDSRAGGFAAGSTPKQQQGLAAPAALQVDGGLATLNSPASSVLRRQKSHHVRNSSDGAVQALGGLGAAGVSAMLMSRSPTKSPTCKGLAFEGVLGGEVDFAETAPSAAAVAAGRSLGGRESSSTANLQQQQQQSDATAGPSPSKAEAAAAAAGSLAVGSEPVLELSVRNASDRYFRAWLGCLPDHTTAESSLTVVAVLEPGDTQRLLAVLPAAVAPGVAALSPPASHSPTKRSATGTTGTDTAAATSQSSSSSSSLSSSGLSEPSRLACAEGLVERLVVCWEMITGAAAAGQLPRGKVQLAPVDVAANLTPGAVAAVCPSPLLLRFTVPPTAAAATELVDLVTQSPPSLASLIASGLPGLSGPLWGLSMSVGQWISVELEIKYNLSGSVAFAASSAVLRETTSDHSCSGSSMPGEQDALQLQISLSVTDLLSSSSSRRRSSTGQHAAGTPTSAAAAAAAVSTGTTAAAGSLRTPSVVDPGVCIMGCYSGFHVTVQPGGRETVRLQVLFVQPGLYQFSVADVVRTGSSRSVSGVSGGGACSSSSSGEAGSKECSRVYYNQDRLYVLVQ